MDLTKQTISQLWSQKRRSMMKTVMAMAVVMSSLLSLDTQKGQEGLAAQAAPEPLKVAGLPVT